MEISDGATFLKSDLDSDVIRTLSGSGDLEVGLGKITTLEDQISKSWEEQRGVWPLELSGGRGLREDPIEELTKSLASEKNKRKVLQEIILQKEAEIKKLQAEKRQLKHQIGNHEPTPPASPNVRDASPSSDREDIGTMEWLKTKTKLIQTIQQLEEDNAKKDARLAELEAECKRISLTNWRTTNEKLKQDVEMEVWRRKFLELQHQQAEREEQSKKKDQEIQYLRSELQLKNEENYKMALKLLDYKSKVSSVELQLRRWPVKKIHKLYPNIDVEIVLTKNPSNGVLSIDVLERGKHSVKPLKSVELVQGVDNRFNISYKDGGVDTFESESTMEIVDSINEVLL